MTARSKYRSLCEQETSIPIFLRDWWLDAVCGPENWDVAIVEKNNEVVGALPFRIKRQAGFTLLNMPPLTSNWGPWYRYPGDQKYYSRLSFEQQTTGELIDQLPRFDYFNQRFRHGVENCLPFYWKKFSLSTRYTYVIGDLNSPTLWDDLNSNIRREIRKAEKQVKIDASDDVAKFYALNEQTFARQRMKMPYTFSVVEKIEAACQKNNCRKILLATDEQGNVHASLYLVWDQMSAYYLMGSHDSAFSSGAFSLLMWESIRHAATVTKEFNFEGSMIESIERFFRSFGARQKPYCQVRRIDSTMLRALFFLRGGN